MNGCIRYFLGEEDFKRVKANITEGGQLESSYRGLLSDIAAVVLCEANLDFSGKELSFSLLIELYWRARYPGLMNREKRRVDEAYEYKNKLPPVDERVVLEEILVDKEVFRSWLIQNTEGVLVESAVSDETHAKIPFS
ncbi:MAG: hypothetical protein U5L75_03255 [Candidatus Campbellbacteria bacterium]|nr:hypothetical protein [Candidatus Campbellbacteria bacterium]